MGNDQRGAAPAQVVEGTLDFGFRHGIQGGGGLVQNQNGGIHQENPGNGHPLLLAAGEQGAPLAYIGLEALGHGLDIRIDLRLLGGLDYLLIRGIGATVANVFQNGVRKQEHILLDNADGLVEAVLLNVPHVLAVNGDAALRYIVKSGNQLAECTLAATGGADDGHGLPGGHVQAHVVEHRQRAVIGEAYVVNPNGACYVFQRLGIRRILNGWLGAHDFYKAVQTREAVGEHLGQGGELAHGVDKGGDIQAEGHQIPIVHFVLHDHEAANRDDHHVQNRQEELHGAVEPAHGLVEGPLGGFEDFVGSIESAVLHILIAKGLGGADAGEAGFDLRIDVSGLLLHPGGDAAEGRPHGHNDEQKNGHQNAHHQSQLPADGGHDDQCADDGHRGGEHILRAMVGQLRQLKQVRGQAAHELTGAVGVVEVVAHVLHMPEQVRPDVRLHPDAEGVAIVADNIVQEAAQYIKGQAGAHQGKEHAEFSVGQQVIEAGPGYQGKGQIDQRNQQGAGDVNGKQLPMVFEVMQKNRQGPLFPVFFRGHG